MSVPQMVVVVTRISALSGPTSGTLFSSSTMRPGSTKIAAFIISAITVLHLLVCRHGLRGVSASTSTMITRK